MKRVVRINANDKRIAYDGEWNGGKTDMWSIASLPSCFLLFRGLIHG